MRQPFFKFAAKNRGDAKRSQVFCIHWRVQAVATEMRARIHLSQRWNKLRRKPRRRMHGHIERDEPRFANLRLLKRLPR